ncbi:hypothetical protein BASA83_013165 [Batrachochytrium salamandrivorans]|nr:hypothetical protein BASA83_013165 [Batrachochytrium salamandrivorans]
MHLMLESALFSTSSKDPCSPDTVQNRKWVMFSARAINSSERNYSATKRELLAIVFALGKFHYYIWGSHFDLFTDHRALTFIFSQKNLNPMIINWLEILLYYPFSIHHRPGILNILPDTLSCLFPARKELHYQHCPHQPFFCAPSPSSPYGFCRASIRCCP